MTTIADLTYRLSKFRYEQGKRHGAELSMLEERERIVSYIKSWQSTNPGKQEIPLSEIIFILSGGL